MRGELAMHGADVLGLRIATGKECLDRGRKGILVADALRRLQAPGRDRLLVVARRRGQRLERGQRGQYVRPLLLVDGRLHGPGKLAEFLAVIGLRRLGLGGLRRGSALLA